MSHLLVFVLCLAGFMALALATRRQQRDLIGRSLPSTAISILRVAGSGALLLALGLLVAAQGWGLGLVMLSGHTSIAAAVVHAALLGYARTQTPAARHG